MRRIFTVCLSIPEAGVRCMRCSARVLRDHAGDCDRENSSEIGPRTPLLFRTVYIHSFYMKETAFIHHSPTYLNGLFRAASLFKAFSTIVACHKATLL